MRAGLHECVRGGRFGEWIHAVDDGFHPAGFEERPNLGPQRARNLRFALSRACAQRRASDREPAQHYVPEIKSDTAPLQESDDRKPTLVREKTQILLEVITANDVEDHVDAALCGDRCDLSNKIL